MKLGVFFVDLFANTLLVFMVLTVLAFSSLSESREETLPAVNLTEAHGRKTGTGGVASVALSARKTAEGVRYFVDDKEVMSAELPGLLTMLKPSSVVLRVDEELPTRVTIRLMALLDSLKITNIIFAYKVE